MKSRRPAIERLTKAGAKIFDALLSLVMPLDPMMSALENMSPTSFLETVSAEALREPRVRRTAPPPDVLALFPYRSPSAKAALVELKERPNKKIAGLLGELLFAATAREAEGRGWLIAGKPRPLVMPIPIARKKKRQRGWNQCDLILDGFRSADRDRIFEARADILRKDRDTDDQVGKSSKERAANVHGCFSVRAKSAVEGRVVIVFDDIVTTGATLCDAKRALSSAGAAETLCFALGH